MNNDMKVFGVNEVKLDLVVEQLEELKNIFSDLNSVKSKSLIKYSHDTMFSLINDIEQNVKTFKHDIDFIFEDKSIKKAVSEKHHQNLQKECTQLAIDIFGTKNYNAAGSDRTYDNESTTEDNTTIISSKDFFGESIVSSTCNNSLNNKSFQSTKDKAKNKSKNKTKTAAVSKKK